MNDTERAALLQMSDLQLIENMLAHYLEFPELCGYDTELEMCMYRAGKTEDGRERMCAIGRMMTDEQAKAAGKEGLGWFPDELVDDIFGVNAAYDDRRLDMLTRLQNWHDQYALNAALHAVCGNLIVARSVAALILAADNDPSVTDMFIGTFLYAKDVEHEFNRMQP